MAKSKNTTVYFCDNCGYESAKWMGQCPICKAWSTFVEEKFTSKAAQNNSKDGSRNSSLGGVGNTKPQLLNKIVVDDEKRISSGFLEMDRVLGGGIINDSLLLIGGDPGIGKSTLLLQLCKNIEAPILYISGEESPAQIKLRGDRLGKFSDNLSLFCETSLTLVEDAIIKGNYKIVVIDSIQTLFREDISSVPGSITQVKEATSSLLKIDKNNGLAIFLVGHVTKEGVVAGPRVLEHMVDTVL